MFLLLTKLRITGHNNVIITLYFVNYLLNFKRVVIYLLNVINKLHSNFILRIKNVETRYLEKCFSWKGVPLTSNLILTKINSYKLSLLLKPMCPKFWPFFFLFFSLFLPEVKTLPFLNKN